VTRPLALACLLLAALGRTAASDVSFKITDAKGQPVADAVVSLVPLDAPATVGPSANAIEVAQQGQEFLPLVTPVRVGTAVTFPNRDTVQHHVYSLSKPKKFDLPLYNPGKAETLVFDQPGIVTIGCNIHDWMLAYVVVLETPWFAKTAADGAALVAGVPPGHYRTEIWHPRLAKIVTRDLTLGGDSAPPLAFALTLKPDHRIRRTPAAGGGGYQ